MIPDALTAIETELRQAVKRKQLAEADRLIGCLGETARFHVSAIPPHDPAHYVILTRVRAILEWTGLMLQTARARCAEDLRLLPLVSLYATSEIRPVPRLTIDL